jgi:hypothetical protein
MDIEQEEVVTPEAEIEAEEELSLDEEEGEEPEPEVDEEEVIITVGDEEPEPEANPSAPGWVKETRAKYKETEKRNRELQQRIRELESKVPVQQTVATDPGEKPTLESHDYDPETFSAALEKWVDDKQAYNKEVEATKAKQKIADEQWQAKLDGYGQGKANLKVKGFEEAESVAQASLHPVQLGIVLQGSDEPAKVVYAIGKDAERAKKLAAITDPVQFAFAIAKLETSLKVTQRAKKPNPPPASIPKGSASLGSADKKLDKLREQARISGDMSDVQSYKRAMKK